LFANGVKAMLCGLKILRGLLRGGLCASAIAASCLSFLPVILVGAAEQKSVEPTKPAAPLAPAAIPLADIATRATDLSNLLGNLTTSAAPSAQIENIAKTLPESSERLDEQFAALSKSLEAEPNWTLSDRLRRVDLSIGVNYGADPKKVIELLEQTARAHAEVLRKPSPRALFMSYGGCSACQLRTSTLPCRSLSRSAAGTTLNSS
jgi:hypothetical protein